jgi:hypothetical protein
LIGRLDQKEKRLGQIKFAAIAEKDERHRKAGEALFPELKSKKFLLERKLLMSPGSWSSEYQQSPILIGDATFPVEKLRVVQVFQRSDIASSVLSIDKAGTAGGDGSASIRWNHHLAKLGLRRARSAVEKFAHDRAAHTMPAPIARRPRPLRVRRSGV